MGSGVLAPDSMKRMKGYRLALTASLLNAIWEAVAANVAASVRSGIPLTIALWEINNDRAYRVSNTADRKEHTSELQSLLRASYAVFCLKNRNRRQVRY